MKATCIFLCCCFFYGHTVAQHDFRFADTTAEWSFIVTNTTMFPPIIQSSRTQTYNVTGDTILGKPYQIIESGWERIFIRQDSTGKVYVLHYMDNWQQESLLMDFGLSEGDSFNISIHSTFDVLKVDSVDTVSWSGLRKRMFLSKEIWVEGIGNIVGSYTLPFSRYIIFDGPSFQLLCFSEKDSLIYVNPKYQTCQYSFDTLLYSSNEELFSLNPVSIAPNPATSSIQISFSKNTHVPVKILLTDISGRQILQTTETTIPVSDLQRGLYFVTTVLQTGQRMVQKIILE